MKPIATYFLGYLVAHIFLISIVQSIFCQDLKILELALIFVAFGIAVFNSKKIILEKSDIIIAFLFVFLNIYYTFIELKGLIFFKMTYVILLSMLLSKVILPFLSSNEYLKKINLIYLILLVGLVIEYLYIAIFGNKFLVDLFMCNGEITGVRGYIELYNITREILPYHIQGLNSLMMAQQGGQTASQLAVIIFIWYLYKYKNNKDGVNLSLALLAVLMLFLSPTIASFFLLFISIVIIYLIYLKRILNKPIKSFINLYVSIFVACFVIYLLVKILTIKHTSLDFIYEKYILGSVKGFTYFNFKEILLGVSYERELELFKLGEISYITQLIKYGFVGVGVFYLSIFYYIIRAFSNKNIQAIVPNVFIIGVFILGNAHYPVMFSLGVMEIFVLHLAYIIYAGSNIKKNKF
ncbi:hypothetical protein [Candidatus Thioglobus sp. NP1]|uniref:hypothetical protein n=1 Tax=Candidatus Thioglobus sp. NP1 TaxID=2508687 RepID=UPI000DEDD40E|nr:hypothetical protein [Candidatus Thioglobus sp. NP1]AXE61706.1 hypothetical protein CRN91_03330 [Candidatus Thioglobus sp. NP1]